MTLIKCSPPRLRLWGISFYTDDRGASRSNRLFRAGRARPLARERLVGESTGAYTSALREYVARLTLLFVLLRAFPTACNAQAVGRFAVPTGARRE